MKEIKQIKPTDNRFSFDTIPDFDNHINLSIQNYSGLIEHIKNISTYFIKDNATVYDLGCSTGNLIRHLKTHTKSNNTKFIGIDKSENLTANNEDIVNMDLVDWKAEPFCFGTCIFTLQFLPITLRKQILQEMYDKLIPGGAIIISEKIFFDDGYTQDVMNFAHYDFKRHHFESVEILNKQVDLRFIMRPLTKKENIHLFKEAGFTKITSFWQSLAFKAWILQKEIV
jgi:tRNA (cmo5U34)-methyltransferase